MNYSCSTGAVHRLGEKLFSIPVAILLGAFIFKGSQMMGTGKLGSGLLQNEKLWWTILIAMAAHICIHTCLVNYIHKFESEDDVNRAGGATFREAEEHDKATYFSLNRIHCLRSKHNLLGTGQKVAYFSELQHV